VCDLGPKHLLIVTPQAYPHMIVTCSTFALYNSFVKFTNQVLAARKSSDSVQAVNKRWEFMKKFGSDF